MLISIDPGKYATKAMSKSQRLTFRTKLSLDPNIDITGNSYKVQFQNQAYIVGEMAEEQSYDVSKASIVHKLATYTAISQLAYDHRIQLVLGCPLSIYKNPDQKSRYKDYIWDNHNVAITVNAAPYDFTIDNILILPESCGIVYLYPSLFKNKRVAVIDLGGLNMNFCIYDNYIHQVSSMFTLNLGGYDLEAKLLNELSSSYNMVLNQQDARYIMQQGGLKLNGKIDNGSITLVNEIVEAYLSKVLQAVKMHNFNLSTLDVCFVGGTSKLIENKIVEQVPHAYIPENSEWCNSEGFYKIGMMKYGCTE